MWTKKNSYLLPTPQTDHSPLFLYILARVSTLVFDAPGRLRVWCSECAREVVILQRQMQHGHAAASSSEHSSRRAGLVEQVEVSTAHHPLCHERRP